MTTYIINFSGKGEWVTGWATSSPETTPHAADAETFEAETAEQAMDEFAARYGVTIRYRTAASITEPAHLWEFSAHPLADAEGRANG